MKRLRLAGFGTSGKPSRGIDSNHRFASSMARWLYGGWMSQPSDHSDPSLRVRVAGTCVLDVRVGPVPLDKPLVDQAIRTVDPPSESVGGVLGNVGIQLARLGMDVSAASRVGDDTWAHTIREQLQAAGIDAARLTPLPGATSGVSFCLVDPRGERVFLTSPGPHKKLDAGWLSDATDDLVAGDVLVLGYYSRLKPMEEGLAIALQTLAARGVRIVMDAAGDGGSMDPLKACLPSLWIYAPSFSEAQHQTGETEIDAMLDVYRSHSASAVLAIKDGERGAWLDDGCVRFHQPAIRSPAGFVDAIGAGDAFVAGLTAAMVRGVLVEEAAALAAANAALSLTQPGGWGGAVAWPELLGFAASAEAVPPA